MPIGVSNFRKLIEHRDSSDNGYLFADKTNFIKEVCDDGAEVILITRPRRFGKTLNLSMLHHFFALEVDGKPTKNLFNNLEISENQKIINEQQGKYPVIFLTFKDIKKSSMQSAISTIEILISMLFEEHRYLLQSESLSQEEKDICMDFIKRKSSQEMLENSLQYLNLFLYNHFKQYAIILIDEYDSPIQEAYLNGYYDEFIKFMHGFFGAGLKDNSWFKKAILTGITRVSKESLFSGVNNLKIYTLLSDKYSSYFGFTENDVTSMIKHTQIDIPMPDIKVWYNGYQCGNTVIYNPWSIINCLDEHGKLKPFWINTSGNDLAKKLIMQSDIRSKVEDLILGKTVEEIIDEHVTFANLDSNSSAIWSLLFMAGYLKTTASESFDDGTIACSMQIPNKEVKGFYKKLVKECFAVNNSISWYNNFITDLTSGNIDSFIKKL
ncbi:MAG: AAA family ATPase, partial [Legionellales bacterium]